MKSLRQAILFWMAVLLFVVGAASAAITYEYVKDESQASYDDEIRQVAEFLRTETAGYTQPHEVFNDPDPDNPFLIQIWEKEGKLIHTTDNTATADPPKIAGFASQSLGPQEWRSYTILGNERIIRVSLPMDQRNEQAPNAAMQVAIPMVVVVPMSWLLLSLLIDRILAGLDRTAARLQNRKPTDHEPISLAQVPKEIVPFVKSINRHVEQVHAQADMQKRFLSDAAHELRTPLTALSIQLENLKIVLRSKEQQRRLAAAIGGSKRANALVNRLLELARHDGQVPQFDESLASCSKSIEAVIAGLRPQAAAKDLNVRFSNHLQYDANFLAQDFSKLCELLLDNAIRYSPAKSDIEITLGGNAHHFELSIADHGTGIDAAKLPLIFERFYRADPHKSEGTGLGLSIAKAICDQHGWHIQLNNRSIVTGIEAIISGTFSKP